MEPGLIIWGQAQPNLILPSINNNGDNDDDDYYDDDDYDDDDENYDDDEKDDQVLLDRPILSGIRLDSTQLCASLSLSRRSAGAALCNPSDQISNSILGQHQVPAIPLLLLQHTGVRVSWDKDREEVFFNKTCMYATGVIRDVPLYRLCSFFNIVKKGGRG